MNALNSIKNFFVTTGDRLYKTVTEVEGIEKITKFAQSFFKAVDTGVRAAIYMDSSIAENHKVTQVTVANAKLLNVTGGIIDVNDLFCGPITGVKEIMSVIQGKKKLTPLETVAKCFIWPVQVLISPVCVLAKWGIAQLGALGAKNYALSIFRVPMSPLNLVKDGLVTVYSIISSILNGVKLSQLNRKYKFIVGAEYNHRDLAIIKKEVYAMALSDEDYQMLSIAEQRQYDDKINKYKTKFEAIYSKKDGLGYSGINSQSIENKWNSLLDGSYTPKALRRHDQKALFTNDRSQMVRFLEGNVQRANNLQKQISSDISLFGHKMAQDILKAAVITTGIAAAIIGTAFFGLGLVLSVAACAMAIGMGYAAYKSFLIKQEDPKVTNLVLKEI